MMDTIETVGYTGGGAFREKKRWDVFLTQLLT
jgi:hypothetical protein